MMKNKRFFLLGVIVLLSLFALWGCPKKSEVTVSPATPKETAPAAEPGKEASKDEGEAKPVTKEESMERAAAARRSGSAAHLL